MQITNNTVFQGTSSSFSPWFDVGYVRLWSLHVTGLEAGGTITVWSSNEAFEPAPSVADANAAQTGSVVGNGANVLLQGSGVCHWMQLQKTAGGTPQPTLVNLFGQST